MESSVIGIDLAKDSFAICEMSTTGKVIRRRVLNRKGLREFGQKTKPTLIAMEACGGSHYWARFFRHHGHSIKMMSAHRVKGVEQQDIDIVMNLREQLMKFKVALTNQVHGIGLEYGVLLPKEKGPICSRRSSDPKATRRW